MSHVQKISLKNFKAIQEFEADFKGCTAIITAGNNKGKTSFLRGIPDRIRFVRPDVMVHKGADKGKGEMVLDTGEKFIWEFDVDGQDKLTYISTDNVKQKVTTELGARFFPPMFDIDKFLQSPPKKQAQQLQEIIGIDFSEIDGRYTIAYNDRTEKNRDAERYHAKLVQMLEVPKVDAVDLTELTAKKDKIRAELNSLYLSNKSKNDEARRAWGAECDKIREQDRAANEADLIRRQKYAEGKKALNTLLECGYAGNEVNEFLKSLAVTITGDIQSTLPAEPTYISEMPDDSPLQAVDAEILAAQATNQKAAEYKNYVEYKKSVEEAQDKAKAADELVKAIEAERLKMIQKANFPKGIAITPEGITVDGFPLDRNQISTSKLYTTALRIASMNLGEVKTLYFDASFLDRNSLAEIEAWASENSLQLLIERPDFEGGEIRYEIVETLSDNSKKKAA